MTVSAEAPPFGPGDRVRVIDLGKPGHVRTPIYARGKVGTIDYYCGKFENPEERAYGRNGCERIALYRVRLLQRAHGNGRIAETERTVVESDGLRGHRDRRGRDGVAGRSA